MPKGNFGKVGAIATVAMVATGRLAFAQNPSASLPDSSLPIYRPPRIAIVQPVDGGVLPQDRPVIMIRFAAGEAGDPIDARSFALSVDGKDQTLLFQVSANDAWGPIAALPADVSVGSHAVAARICSARGACSATAVAITVTKPVVAGPGPAKGITRKQRVMDAFLGVLRSLLKQ